MAPEVDPQWRWRCVMAIDEFMDTDTKLIIVQFQHESCNQRWSEDSSLPHIADRFGCRLRRSGPVGIDVPNGDHCDSVWVGPVGIDVTNVMAHGVGPVGIDMPNGNQCDSAWSRSCRSLTCPSLCAHLGRVYTSFSRASWMGDVRRSLEVIPRRTAEFGCRSRCLAAEPSYAFLPLLSQRQRTHTTTISWRPIVLQRTFVRLQL